jgi:formate--tetrahydrofolate ligase
MAINKRIADILRGSDAQQLMSQRQFNELYDLFVTFDKAEVTKLFQHLGVEPLSFFTGDIPQYAYYHNFGLKDITINSKNYSRKEKFDITAASEIMAILCLSKDLEDLKVKLDRILIGYSKEGKPLFAKDLNVTGSMQVLLMDAIKPNLVQTLEHNPVIIHGGPFANIAHGCSSVIATTTAMKLGDYCITEAGFGSDLGALKFFDIKCRETGLMPDATVLVTTIKALKYNGNDNIEEGIVNLKAHIDILKNMTKNIIVCLNKYDNDTDEDIAFVEKYCKSEKVKFAVSTAYKDGGVGAIPLAEEVLAITNKEKYKKLYDVKEPVEDKIDRIVKDLFKASKVNYSEEAKNILSSLKENNLDNLPVVVAKTQYSISDNKDVLGNPENYEVTVRNVKLYNGAGFITIYLGSIIAMPGLPKKPNYEKIYLEDNEIVGLS